MSSSGVGAQKVKAGDIPTTREYIAFPNRSEGA
jgi:hypothetical protein